MIKKYFSVILGALCVFPTLMFAQITENFSDGDFTSNPAWNGDASYWQVVSGQLNSNGPAVTGSFIYLSTPSTTSSNCQWEFFVNPKTTTTSGNYIDIFLTSDSSKLSGNNSGYFVRIGGTNHEVSLFLKQLGVSSVIIDGSNSFLTSLTNNPTKVKIIRSAANQWDLYADAGGTGTNYVLQGSVTDASISSSAYFGILVKYSSPNVKKYFFDDITVGPIVVDNTPPSVLSASVTSINSVDVLFSESVEINSAQTLTNFLVNNALGNPNQATLDVTNHAVVHLGFASNFSSGTSYTLTASNIQDLNTNTISVNNTANFTYTAPVLPAFKDVVINEIFPDPSPQIGLPALEFIEIYNQSNKTLDLSGWKFNSSSTTGTLPAKILMAGQYLILCKNTDTTSFQTYGSVLGLSVWPALVNTGTSLYLKDNLGNFIDSVKYDLSYYHDQLKQGGGWSLELINPGYTGSCPESNNWSSSTDTSGGTPGKINSIFSTASDLTPPSINGVTVIDSMHIQVCLSEPITNQSANSAYLIDHGMGNPSVVKIDTVNTNCVNLTLSTTLTKNLSYGINLVNAFDCSGNAANTALTNFVYSAPIPHSFKDLVINEIFADPSPQVHLPNVEFIEVYNNSNKTINLSGWKFSNLTSTGTLTAKNIGPAQYLILCKMADTALFSGFGNFMGLVTWPSINNAGTSLFIKDNTGKYIDSVKYDLNFYHDVAKQAGGWTMELVNPTYNGGCSIVSNWKASIDTMGGTPGLQNSVYSTAADVTGPFILNVTVIDSVHINVCMNEFIGSAINKLTTYTLDNGLGNPSIAIWDSVNTDCVKLTLSQSLKAGITYGIKLSNATDCSGNVASTASFSFLINSSASNKFKDIIINEIFADPSPQIHLPNAEFIELYNRSSNVIDLASWKFKSTSTTTATLSSYYLLPGKYLTLCSNADTAAFRPFGPVMGLVSWPSLTNGGTSIYLKDNQNMVIDSVKYDLSFYQNTNKQAGGWSMELINPNYPQGCYPQPNWSASVDTMGGTPGKQNSIYSTQADITGPKISGVSILDATHITVCLNEGLSGAWNNTNSYTINNGIGKPSAVKKDSASVSCVYLTLSSPLSVNTIYTISLTGISDCSGNPVNSTPYAFTNYSASPLDVQFNEIMADESPVVNLPAYEYVELYNKTSMRINMLNWTFSAGTSVKTLPSIDIEADSFVVITSVAGKAAFSASLPVYSLSSFPALVNSGSLLVLKTDKGLVMDTVHYYDTWYQDATKKNGGWSLEKIDPFLGASCVGSVNWIASNDQNGGTPGLKNSVYAPDLTGPLMATYTVTDSMHLSICFNEAVDTTDLKTKSNYSFDHGIGSPFAVSINSSYCVNLTLSVALKAGTAYNMTISNMKDCSGNIGLAVANPIGFNAPIANFNKTSNWVNINFTDASSISPGSITGWDWDFGDGSIHGNTPNPAHTYATSGNYTVCLSVTASNALSDSVCKSMHVDNVGIAEKEESLFHVYPNPSNGNIVVEGNNIKQLSVSNVSGVCVYQMNGILNVRKNIDLQNLPSGVYFIKAGNDNLQINKIITINR